MCRARRRRRSRALDLCSKRKAHSSRSAKQRARLDARRKRRLLLTARTSMSRRRLAMVTCGSSRDAEDLASSSFFWRWARRRRFWRAWRRSRASAGVRTIRRDGGTGVSVVSGSADDADDAAGFLAVEASVRVEGVARWRMRARGGSLAGALSATGAFFGVASELSFPWGKLKTTGDAPSSRFPWRRRGPWWRRGWRRGPGDRLLASGTSDLSGEAQQSLQL